MRIGWIGLLFFLSPAVWANEVDILEAVFNKSGDGWRVSVTLKHADTGWDHYADAWRVVLPSGDVAGTRTLFHPHVEEQPFTRSLSNVNIPDSIETVYIEAHDKVHGWSKQRLKVDLTRDAGKGFKVNR